MTHLLSLDLCLGFALALAPLAAACGTTSDAAPTQQTAKAQASSTSNDQQLCVEMFTRSRTCTDDYIPALVDSRAKLDNPPGIAGRVKADRAGVIAEAKQEWVSDSTDASIAANCQHLVAGMAGDRSDVDTVHGCLAQPDCAAFATCITPVFEKHTAK